MPTNENWRRLMIRPQTDPSRAGNRSANQRRPVPAHITPSGIVAHESALKDGELLKIPQYAL